MAAPQQKYKIRPGTVDSGKEYEAKIAALLSLRCVLHGVDEMWIASNADGIGAFDDIILHAKTAKNDQITFMMQLKHKEHRNKIQEQEFLNQKGDFSLKSYFQDISDLQRSISSNFKTKIVEHLGQFDNIYFVFFTNRGVYENSVILQKENEPNGPICFLKDVLNTNATMNRLFTFNLEKLSEIASNNNLKNVFLLANQLSSNHIDKLIANKIKELVDPAGLAQVDLKGMVQNYLQYIKDWARGILGGHYCLTKQDVLAKISELVLNHYAVNLRQNQLNFYDCYKKNIWNQIMSHETITIVDSNDQGLEFLVKYIGSEVGKYCDVSNVKSWSENLPDQAKTLFYETHRDLEEQMQQKVVGNFGKITLFDVYKCLWMVKRLPLLLEVKRIEDYENILHVLKLTNYSYKVIVINNSMGNLPNNQAGIKTFCTLQDLRSYLKYAILKLPIKLQGRAGVALESVIDETMHHYIKCNDIISIFLENFNIGNNIEQLTAYFIERSFIKTFIKAEALREVEGDVFLLDNRSDRYVSLFPQNNFNAWKPDNVDVLNNCKVILLQENDGPEVIEKIKSVGKTVHYLTLHDQNCFQRKWSFGSTRNIKPFKFQGKEEYEKDFTSCFSNIVNIISDTAGMGKSTLLDFLQHRAPTNKWVIRVNLNSHQKYFYDCKDLNTNPDATKYLRYFNDMMFAECSQNAKLSQMVFDKLLNQKDVIVLLDGFDEVSYSHEDEVIKIAKCLCLEGYHIWLTTRPHMQSNLEETFETFSISLKPFSVDDQQQFLIKFFSAKNSEVVLQCEHLLKQFVEKLLQAARKNLNDWDAKFTGIPLQGKLLAEVFNEDCKIYLLSKGTVCFNETFNLVYLYQNFVDKKIDILCNKFGGSAIDLHNMVKKHQSLFALKLLYSDDAFVGKHIDKELEKHYKEEPDKIQLLQRDGIITVDEKLNINCTHRTFAEFLVAKWFSENLNSEQAHINEFIGDIIIKRKNQFLCRMLDYLLVSNKCPAHLAMINRQMGKAKKIISLDVNSAVKTFDTCGRSILHIIAYSSRVEFHNYFELYFKSEHVEWDYELDIIKIIPDDALQELAVKKDVLGYTPLDYALLNHSFAVANQICTKIKTVVTINTCLFNEIDLCYCKRCLEFNFQPLFEVVLPCAVCNSLLMKRIDLDLDVFSCLRFSDNVYINDDNCFLDRYKNVTLLEIMQSKSGYPYSGFVNNHYLDLRFAAAFGTKKNVLKLLSAGLEINRLDHNTYAPLHYAVLHGRSKIIKTLLLNGADVNMENFGGRTSLHLAVAEGISCTIGVCFFFVAFFFVLFLIICYLCIFY